MPIITKNPLIFPKTLGIPNTPISGTKGIYPTNTSWNSIDDDGNIIKMLDETDKTEEITDEERDKLPTAGAVVDYIDSVMPEGENHYATLLAMYNEISEPSPAEWFTVSGDTITGFDWKNEDFLNASSLVFPYEINGVGIRHLDIVAENKPQELGGSPWYNNNVKKVRFPNCIKDMRCAYEGGGEYPFGQIMPNMHSANIPTSCTHIYGCFFAGCGLTEIITPVKPNWGLAIDSMCFAATALESIDNIIDGVNYIEQGTFSDCPVKNVVIPASVSGILIDAFNCSDRLESFTVLNPHCDMGGYEVFYNGLPKIVKGYKGSTAEKFVEDMNALIAENESGEFDGVEPIRFVSLEGVEFAEIENELGDIDSALDGIIAIQNNYIGGESA